MIGERRRRFVGEAHAHAQRYHILAPRLGDCALLVISYDSDARHFCGAEHVAVRLPTETGSGQAPAPSPRCFYFAGFAGHPYLYIRPLPLRPPAVPMHHPSQAPLDIHHAALSPSSGPADCASLRQSFWRPQDVTGSTSTHTII
jgi:hypothetical protein